MRIGFDAKMAGHAGIGRYICSLLPELVKQAPEDDFIVFGGNKELEHIANEKNVEIVPWNAPIYSLSEQITSLYGKYGLDVLHVPHFNIPVFYGGKMIVTIHDLIYLMLPESVSSPLVKLYAWFMTGRSLSKASRVISISDSTKNDLISVFGTKYSEKIRTIHEAASGRFRIVEKGPDIKDIQKKYGLSDKIILYVGSIKPHKNIGTLIKAFRELKNRNIPHQLIITGKWDKKEDHLLKDIDNKDIKYIGEISTDDLVLLYNHADILVHLSKYEGFGLTVLEAMQCGTPVVVSGTSSLPEIAGNAALIVDPLDIGQISDTVYNVLTTNSIKKGLIERGLERAARFSWQETARQTLETYHKA